ncbi:CLUMA_CG019780, isoform A [Clunio marinus]|uniref:CLUMA_CG019780, isoform A n=1 Tax=Clunio marinus TaxID=568069 RepID=A0A1J1J2Z4_9DIPT|nr:CLUMA_CG019780, isoform A [Clunio marinus]
MWTINSFLCWELETGGLVIGWLCLISYILTSLILGFVSLAMVILSCEEIDEYFDHSMSICENYSLYLFIIVFGTILCILSAYLAYLLIKGTKQRNHSLIMPMMISMVFGTALELLNLLKLRTLQQYVQDLVTIIIYCYMTLVLFSLYDKFKKEKTQKETEQNQGTADMKV